VTSGFYRVLLLVFRAPLQWAMAYWFEQWL